MRRAICLIAAVCLILSVAPGVQAGARGAGTGDRNPGDDRIGPVTLQRLVMERTLWMMRLSRIEVPGVEGGVIRPDGLSDGPDPIGIKGEAQDHDDDDRNDGSGTDSNTTQDTYSVWGPVIGGSSGGTEE